ncbi:hypothetical protein [Amycolatopsis sp. NPDC051102]|uniref:hypothetical protein n=1 Tax=Amycolatopsis sp. NPDC051102 TaxID=3155163 RepID=UPI00343AA8F1
MRIRPPTTGFVVLLGRSRGGGLARLAAARRPDLARGRIMPGSPVGGPMGAHPVVFHAAPLSPGVPAFVGVLPPRRARAVAVLPRSGATHAEVGSSHLGMPANPDVDSAIGPVLTTWADDADERDLVQGE